MAYTQTETPASLTFLVSESEGPFQTRDAVKVPVNTALLPGTVLGAYTVGAQATAAAAADAGNTGNGTIAMDGTTPVLASAIDGDYRIVFLTATTFEVINPKGKNIGKGATGAAFSKDIKFTITAGGTAYVAGDALTVSVGVESSTSDRRFVPLNLSATDGSQNVTGIAGYRVISNAADEQVTTAITSGPAEVRGVDLIWPAGITAAQKAEGIEQLRRLNIKVR
ncbi:putative phage protein GP19 [Methylobacterium sp. 4-46]|uniref:head decoration protein n=1 Tax=unclassified Methylobacterium TaxID=2615210 RepID=UPI000152DF4B|nr:MULTISPECIES: head decoration protein [Methylobacterium]ACA18499.1 putative phage protein GP19 [Methylobacterium sp. 4-46]WFT77787.1 head decoration protein [Methylobacterium nodulans]